MKKVLHVFEHISFTIAFLVLSMLLLFSDFNVKNFKGETDYEMSLKDASTKFEESNIFNQMFGVSISDILNYGSLNYKFNNTPELHNSVSANSIDGGSTKKDLNNYQDILGKGNTNLNYFVIATFSKDEDVFTNVGKETDSETVLKKNILDSSEMYIYYNTATEEFDTNTRLHESTVDKLIANSGYSEATNVTVMIGLNNYLGLVDDAYKDASLRYENYTQFIILKIAIILIALFLYICIMIMLTMKEGVYRDRETNAKIYKGTYLDNISIEIRLFLLFILYGITCFLAAEYTNSIRPLLVSMYVSNYIELMLLIAGFLLIISIIIDFFYFGMVRRIRTGLIYKTSYIYRLIKLIAKLLAKGYQNVNVLIKAVVPLGVLFLVNILGAVFGIKSLVFLIIVDVAAIYIEYLNLSEKENIFNTLKHIADGDIKVKVDEANLHLDNPKWGNAVNSIGDSVKKAVDLSMKNEKMKADLITNVSHDLKTPLTSIINYVDLLKREDIDNDKAIEYITILDEKSQRLKQMTDDLVEASKISSGNVVLNMEKLNVKELILQATGEFSDRFLEKNLNFNGTGPDEAVYINADSRSIYRVVENLFINIYKYALPGTRVYLDIATVNDEAVITIKNISANPITVSTEDLTERFIRGDESRTSEGSGLGLSIAKSLTEAMGGRFVLSLDGDLFKVTLGFKLA